jgi:NTE family protein
VNQNGRKKPQLGLALSGGAERGVAHIGVLRALEIAEIEPQLLAGTSIGALVAAFRAFNIPVKKMFKQAQEMSWTSISKFSFAKDGLLTNDEIGNIVKKHIGDVNIEDAPIPLAIVATDIRTGDKVVMRKGNLAKAVMASSAIPGIFRPVKIDERLLVDGFLVENIPISPLKEMGADVIMAVSLSTLREYREPDGILNILMNAFEIAVDINNREILRAADVVIMPKLSDIKTDDDAAMPQELYEEGLETAKEKLPELRQILEKKEKELNRGFFRRLLSFFS